METILTLAFDPGSSSSKVIYQWEQQPIKYLTLEPEIIEVPTSLINQYQQENLFGQNLALLKVAAKSYVVGSAAKQLFHTHKPLRESKEQRIVSRALAILGLIALQADYQKFKLNLLMLLPANELGYYEELKQEIKQNLTDFSYNKHSNKVTLNLYKCIPEGGGLLAGGSISQTKAKSVLVLMMGYRNASYLLKQNNLVTRKEVSEFGFIRVLERLPQVGLEELDLIERVCQIIKGKPVARSRDNSKLKKAVKVASKYYLVMLFDWLKAQKFPHLDVIVLSGGTAYLYGSDLEKYFSNGRNDKFIQPLVSWEQSIEQQVEKLLKDDYGDKYKYRFTDILASFFWFKRIEQKNNLIQV